MAKLIGAFAELLVVGILLVVILTFSVAYGWLADNRKVTGNGFSVSAQPPLVEISETPTGEDIGVLEPSAGMTYLTLAATENICPGSCGSVSFYVRQPGRTGFSFSFRVGTVNNAYSPHGNEGFFPGVTDEERRADALRYLNSHLMFFTDRSEDGVYSGRIAPGEAVQITATEADAVQGAYPVTVYWVWVPWYSDIFSADSTLMAEADRESAAAYYSDSAHAAEMFRDGNADEQGFNEADYIIGTTLKYICFDLTVQGG